MSRNHRSPAIPERFLRQLWKQQYFDASHLTTLDHRPVEICSPGILNTDGGPDFRGARIRIGDILYAGDVELHQNFIDWNNHAHDRDLKYNSVILHVVFRNVPPVVEPFTVSQRRIPVLVLESHMQTSYTDAWNAMILSERAERLSAIRCFPRNRLVDKSVIAGWLSKLALQRFELKVLRFEERLKELVTEDMRMVRESAVHFGEIPFRVNMEELPPPVPAYSTRDYRKPEYWEQLLYEGVMEALGYAKNQAPFLSLARLIRLKTLAEFQQRLLMFESCLPLEAVLFGCAGLLERPPETSDMESHERHAFLLAHWRQFRETYRGETLSPAEWQFFRLRPENFPSVRIAGAAEIVRRMLVQNLLPTIIQTIRSMEHSAGEMMKSLEELFIVDAADFWRSHYRIGEVSARPLQRLIGRGRADEIILNVVVPVVFLYARIFREKEVRKGVLFLLHQFPPVNQNTITRTMTGQLMRDRLPVDSVMIQQGLLQLYKFYCVGNRCPECPVWQKLPAARG